MSGHEVRVIGRYALYGPIAAGGMATVHLGRLLGPVGFSRTVAIKRLHAQFASDPEFVSMFLDEARLAARIRHPNVVPTLDVVATGGELFLVMDYVPGESMARLARALRDREQSIPLRIISTWISGALHGLHAAHEAKDERGHPLGIVHRDVSPQNVLIGTDGVPRVLDFGVAKAVGRMQTTKEGQLKGKIAYMPPEQLRGAPVGRQTDIYSAGVMLWELLTGQRLFDGDHEAVVVTKILAGRVERPSDVVKRMVRPTMTEPERQQLEILDETVLRALSMEPEARFATAREMALEIERRCPPATATECSDWVEAVARDSLSLRAAMVAEIESSASRSLDAAGSSAAGAAVNEVLNAPATADSHRSLPGGGPMRGGYPSPIPPVTQPSSISVTTGSTPSTQVPRGMLYGMLAVALLSLSVLVGALVYRHSKAVPFEGAASEPSPAPIDDPAPPTASETPAPPPPKASVERADAPPRTPADSGSAVRMAPSHAPPVLPIKPKPAVKTASSSRGSECNPPFYYDKEGVKHYREHCVDE